MMMVGKWDKTGEIFEKHPCIYTQRGQVWGKMFGVGVGGVQLD